MNNKIKIGLGIFIIISIILIILKLKGEFSASTSTSTPTSVTYNYDLAQLKVYTDAFEGEGSSVIVVNPSNNNNTSILSFDVAYLTPIKNGIVEAESRLWDNIVKDISNNITSSSTSTLIDGVIGELLSKVNTEIAAYYARVNADIKNKYVIRRDLIKLSSAHTSKPISFSSYDNALVADWNKKETDNFYII
jgi:hypothetical protein